jgi:WD40 repeat protein
LNFSRDGHHRSRCFVAPGVLENALHGPPPSSSSSSSSIDQSTSSGISNDSKIEIEGELEVEENPLNLPITHEIVLKGHKRLISSLVVDPSGSRVLTGSYDFNVNMWDFSGIVSTSCMPRVLFTRCYHAHPPESHHHCFVYFSPIVTRSPHQGYHLHHDHYDAAAANVTITGITTP